jgi:hypothetical protein
MINTSVRALVDSPLPHWQAICVTKNTPQKFRAPRLYGSGIAFGREFEGFGRNLSRFPSVIKAMRNSTRKEMIMAAADGPEVTARETVQLIASDKVEGTAVRRADGDKLGTIKRVMIDKMSGKVAYAVMTFGGFLGIGDEYRALPWSLLRYNVRLDAYELNVTDDQLRNAPALAGGWDTGSIDRDWERNVHDYYRTSVYW